MNRVTIATKFSEFEFGFLIMMLKYEIHQLLLTKECVRKNSYCYTFSYASPISAGAPLTASVHVLKIKSLHRFFK